MTKNLKIWGLRETLGVESFEQVRLISKIALGEVYLVRLKGTKEYYAMKVQSKEKMIKQNRIQRVLTEREILTSTRHPFIVTYYHSFETESHVYIIMEYCICDLYKLLRKRKRLKEHEILFFVREILLALEYLHFVGFIYRDLKPENILISSSGHIRLADFDLSQKTVMGAEFSLNEKDVNYKLKEIEIYSFVGTEEYISPEMLLGTGHSSLVDWWSLGILAYESFYGKTPFKGFNMKTTFRNILEGEVRFTSDVKISKNSKDFIKKCLLKKKKRLGCDGIASIKNHPWMRTKNWPYLNNKRPPIDRKKLRELGFKL